MASDFRNRGEMEAFELPDDLRAMFASYREALPDREPASDFMPQLWTKIDARRSISFSFGRLAKGFVSVALASCLAMSILFLTPVKPQSPIYGFTYLDALAADHSDDVVDVELSHAGESI
jgi:hypothetical protein